MDISLGRLRDPVCECVFGRTSPFAHRHRKLRVMPVLTKGAWLRPRRNGVLTQVWGQCGVGEWLKQGNHNFRGQKENKNGRIGDLKYRYIYVSHHHTFSIERDEIFSIKCFCRILFSVVYSLVVEEAVNRTASHSLYKYIYLVCKYILTTLSGMTTASIRR